MGFWDFMDRMLSGKPVFDRHDFRDEDGNPVPVDEAEAYPEPQKYSSRPAYELPVDEHGYEIFPDLQIIQSRVHESGEDFLSLWVTIKNNSDRLLELETTDIVGQKQHIRHRFVPGQERQIEVYKGEVPKHDNYKYAILYFKELPAGHYFNSVHQIIYHIEHSTRFLPMRFQYLRAFKNA